jgi:rhodanese-related sulfurtransferase
MKNLRITLLITLVTFLVAGTSCSNKDNELDPFYEYGTASSFYNQIVAKGGFDGEARIVDFRSPADFAEGAIKGAINIEATPYNASSVDGAFIKQLNTIFPDKSKPVFLYGGTNNTLVKLVAGHVSKSGYGKSKTHILGGRGFDMWKEAYPELVEIPAQ